MRNRGVVDLRLRGNAYRGSSPRGRDTPSLLLSSSSFSSSAAVPEVPRPFSSDNHPAERDARHDTLLAIEISQENGRSALPTVREAFVNRGNVENVCGCSIEKVLAKKQRKSSSYFDRL